MPLVQRAETHVETAQKGEKIIYSYFNDAELKLREIKFIR